MKSPLSRTYADAKRILQPHRGKMDLAARELLKREMLDEHSFRELLSLPESEERLWRVEGRGVIWVTRLSEARHFESRTNVRF